MISGTDIDSTTGANSASTRPRSSRVRHRVSVIAARTPRSDTRPAANACSVAGISVTNARASANRRDADAGEHLVAKPI